MDNIYGTILKVTFFNKENGYGIVKIKLNYQDRKIAQYRSKLFTNQLTVLCYFDRLPVEDEEYDFVGEFINSQYGIQLKATSFSRRSAKTKEGVVSYLSSDLFSGIGKATATKVFTALGENCLDMIIENYDVLNQVPDLTDTQKDTIYQRLIENVELEKTYVGLASLGISMAFATKIISVLHEKAVDIIKEDPYKLIDLVEGIGFARADKIASSVGIKKESPIRIKAYINYSIKTYTYSVGNTYIEKNELFNKMVEILNTESEILTKELYDSIISDLFNDNKIFIDEEDNIYEYYTYRSEEALASRIVEGLSNFIDYGYQLSDIDKALDKVIKTNKIAYNEKQLKAIKVALKENIMVITGGPGTGKSTVIKGIIDTYSLLLENDLVKEEIALLAPTGRASKRLTEVTGYDAQTIHRFLGYLGENKFRHGPNNPVDARLVIIDEMSMVDIAICARLFTSLPDYAKIVIVGDVDQLPSVGPGQVLSDLIKCGEISVVKLDIIHRQAEGSTIITLANAVNNGLLPENILEKQPDRNFIALDDNLICDNIIKVVKQGLSVGMDLIKDIQVLIPLYKGELGINHVNSLMQEAFNPFTEVEISNLGRKFRVNDKVIQLVNRPKKQIMNGDIGYIIALDFERDEAIGLTVLYDSGPVDYKVEELEDISHAYAISIHKAQGSEFSLVVIPYSNKHYIMLKRKLIYTAITRAKKFLIMLGNIEALNNGTKQMELPRKTKLIERIKEKISNPPDDVSPYDFLD